MHSPTLAILGLTWGRHRWGLAALVVGLAGLCLLHRNVPTQTVISETTMAGLAISVTVAFFYIIYAFSYAELGARVRTSGFPPWLFTLPVPTYRLVFWPMLSGAVAIAGTWLAVAHFILRPAGLDVQVVWPALALAVSLAWVQAMDWSPLGGVTKALVAGAVLTAIWFPLLNERYHDAALIGVPCLLPLAFLVAVAGVGHARRGGRVDIPLAELLGRVVARLPRRRRPFGSPGRALLWWDFRRNGVLLPVLVGCGLVILTLFVHRWEKTTVLQVIVLDLIYLPFLGVLVGCVLGKPDLWSRPLRLPSFLGVRPVRTGDLVIAKLKSGALSVLATWLLIAACGVLWLALTDSFSEVGRIWQHWLEYLAQQDFQATMKAGDTVDPDAYMAAMEHPVATARAYALLALYAGALFGFTWLLLVGNLVASLAGRLWVLAGAFFFYLAGLPNLMVFQSGLHSSYPKEYDVVMDALPWIATVLVAIKLSLAGWALHRGYRRGLLTAASAVGIVLVWCLIVALIVPTAYYFITSQRAAWRHVALACVLLCPLVRIAGAPLVLEWNRRR
jgi:hypothetical protein